MLPVPNDDRTESQPAEVSQMAERLTQVEWMIQSAADDWERNRARNAALYIRQAAAITRHRAIQTRAAALVMDAERALVKANPPTPPEQIAAAGGRAEPVQAVKPVGKATMSHMRAAHSGLPDTEYQRIRQRSLDTDTPLTRHQLTSAAANSRKKAQPPQTRLKALPYVGGKSAQSPLGIGSWITTLLPYDDSAGALYAEPFGGMAGVLLNRTPTWTEIYNDINGRITNWWLVLRRWPDELERELDRTPYSEQEFEHCKQNLDCDGRLERARCFTVVAGQSIMHSDGPSARWSLRPNLVHARLRWPLPAGIQQIADRMKLVQISNRPAANLLERLAPYHRAVIYCDPPYPKVSEAGSLYRMNTLETTEFGQLLRRQAGRVAVSGNIGDFDDILPGWLTMSRDQVRTTPVPGGISVTSRTECLYMNYDPDTGQRLDAAGAEA